MNGRERWIKIIRITGFIWLLCIVGCSSGKRGQMPLISDYGSPNAEIHADNVGNFWERTKLKYQEDKAKEEANEAIID